MNSRRSGWLLLAALALACQAAGVKSTKGTTGTDPQGSGPGGGPNGGPSLPGDAGLGYTLPDASDAQSSAPAAPTKCAEDVHQAERSPVDLLMLVDISGSMTEDVGGRSKWHLVKDAIGGFLKDPGSAGIGVGMHFFPVLGPPKDCNAEAECPGRSALFSQCVQWTACAGPGDDIVGAPPCEMNAAMPCKSPLKNCVPVGRCSASGRPCLPVGQPCKGGAASDMCMARGRTCRVGSDEVCPGDYGKPVVPIAPLPQNEPALSAAIEKQIPRGGTPMGPAVEGGITHMQAHLAANPGRRAAIVLVSDGLPDGFCNRNFVDFIGERMTAASTGNPSLPTYVIGVFSQTEVLEAMPALQSLARAGGTMTPYLIMTNSDLTRRFQEALDKIRGSILPCEFQIPPPKTGTIDFGKVNVSVQSGAGNEEIPYVGSKDRCDPMRGGWHYDRDPKTGSPTRVLLCEATCGKAKTNPAVKVEVRFGCATREIN